MHGKDLFDQHAKDWLAYLGIPDGEPFEAAIEQGKAQILADVRRGRAPASVASFAELHDYVDANLYGEADLWPVLPSETDDDAYQQAHADFWNQVQDTLSDWIASGQMREEARQRGGTGRG